MITALATEEAKTKALSSGADDFLTKPVSPRQVVERIEKTLRRRDQVAPILRRPRPQPDPSKLLPPHVGVVIAALPLGGNLAQYGREAAKDLDRYLRVRREIRYEEMELVGSAGLEPAASRV